MNNFPLFDNLQRDINNISIDLTNEEKKQFMEKIQLMNTDGFEKIYVIIQMYSIEYSTSNTSFSLPYSGTILKDEIRFDLEKLPIKLRHMIYRFINIHTDIMKEDTIREKQYQQRPASQSHHHQGLPYLHWPSAKG